MKHFEDIQRKVREKRIQTILNHKEFSKDQKEIVDRFYGYLQRKGLKLESVRNYLENLKLLLKDLPKDLKNITRKDIEDYLVLINKYKPKTVSERRKFLLLFYEWYYQKKKEDIDLIKDIQIMKDNGIKLPEEILNPEEIKRMVQVADSFRDKAILILLYETACRKGEFLQLRIKHVDIVKEEYGLITIPMGKTDSRKLPIIYSVPHLQNWLNAHPNRNDPNSPLFINLGAWKGRGLGEDGLKRLIKIVAKRGGIKKRVYPHLFRHARLTELAKVITEQELKIFSGWTKNSNMASIYVHLSGQDVSDKILANAGLIDTEVTKKGDKTLMSVKCPRCNKTNPSDNKYCDCGFVLDIVEVNKLLEQRREGEKQLNSFIDPKQIQSLFKTIHKLQKDITDMKENYQ